MLCNEQKGFSYVEVLIAAAILSIMLAPVLAGLMQSKKNFKYAMDAYRADWLAKSLLLDSKKAVRQGRINTADSFEAWIDGHADIYDRESFDYAVYVRSMGDAEKNIALSTHDGPITPPSLSGEYDFASVADAKGSDYDETLVYDDGFVPYTGSIAEVGVDRNRCRLRYKGDARVQLAIGRCNKELIVDIQNPDGYEAVLDIFPEDSEAQEHIKIKHNGHAGTTVRFMNARQIESLGSTWNLIVVEVLSKDGRLLRRLEGI